MEPARQPDPQPDPGVADLLRANFSDKNSMIDASLPTAAFLIAYLVGGSQLRPAIVAALAAAVLIAVLRAVRRESLRHIVSGLLGVAVCAFIANRTNNAEDFFLPGLLLNVVYAAAFAISAMVRKPLVGLGIRFMSGDDSWHEYPPLRRAAYRATWLWAGVFGLRVAVQAPLYLAENVGALGAAKLVMGFPIFLLALAVSYRLLSPPLAQRRRLSEAQEELEQPRDVGTA